MIADERESNNPISTAVEENRRLTETILQENPMPTIIWDRDLRVKTVNKAFLQMTGYDRKKAESMTIKDFELDGDRSGQEIMEVFRTNRTISGEIRVTLPTGTFSFIRYNVPLPDGASNVENVMAVYKDITDQKLAEEDPTFRTEQNQDTGQTVIKGMGELHLDILVDRMKREFNVEANVGKPQVAYRETIRRTVDKHDYTHKKQTGGSGQFAKVQISLEPMEVTPEKIYEFENKVTGGRIPREYIPSIDAGFQASMAVGVLAGYPMVGVRGIILDGAAHDVDSSEMAFKIAGSMAFKEAARKASPVLLEPLMAVEVRTPEEYMGDVIGDLNSRRGQIQSMEDATGVKVVTAKVPLSEMFGYVGDLRSKTSGRAVYSMSFDSYSEVPKAVADEIIQKNKGE